MLEVTARGDDSIEKIDMDRNFCIDYGVARVILLKEIVRTRNRLLPVHQLQSRSVINPKHSGVFLEEKLRSLFRRRPGRAAVSVDRNDGARVVQTHSPVCSFLPCEVTKIRLIPRGADCAKQNERKK